jgi:hypothetical protein
MDIAGGGITVRRGGAGRATAAGLALVATLSGAFAFGRATTNAPTSAPRDVVVRRVVVESAPAPVIRPKGHGTVKLGSSADHGARHAVKWG